MQIESAGINARYVFLQARRVHQEFQLRIVISITRRLVFSKRVAISFLCLKVLNLHEILFSFSKKATYQHFAIPQVHKHSS
jgi:hypothetical protein